MREMRSPLDGFASPHGVARGRSIAGIFAMNAAKGYVIDADPQYLFQDMVGTSVTTPGQTAQLMLDPSQGLAVGANLLGTAWTMGVTGGTGTATNSPAGTLNLTGDGVNAAYGEQSFTTVAGRTYRLECNVSVSQLQFIIGTSSGGAQLFAATVFAVGDGRVAYFTATTTTTWVRFYKTGAALTTVSGVTCKHIAGVHNIQPTAAARPIYGIKPFRGRVNELTHTRQFDNIAWGKTAITVAAADTDVDPEGETTAEKLVENTANSTHLTSRAQTYVAGTYTFSVHVKAAGRTFVRLVCFDNTTNFAAFFDLSNGTVGNLLNAPATAITNVGNGWYRCSITFTATAGTGNLAVRVASANGTDTYLGDGASGVLVWGAQIEQGALSGYQRIGTTVYDCTETGQATVHYLRRQTNKWMQTAAAVDLSDRDCVAVVAGMRKMSDAAQGAIVELTTSPGTIPQSFSMQAPGSGIVSFRFLSSGSNVGVALADITGIAAPVTRVVTGQADISGDTSILRLNGVQVAASVADQGTGNYANALIYSGARAGTSLFVDDELSFLAVVSTLAPISAADLSRIEAIAASKCGVSL